MKYGAVAIVLCAVLVVVLGWRFMDSGGDVDAAQAGTTLVEVNVPSLSTVAIEGEAIFNKNCSVCHGKNAAGVDGSGPPLVHVIYEPNHHGDASFYIAVRQGVRAHHWPFGNMLPIQGVSEDDVKKVIVYVRELQRANGIR